VIGERANAVSNESNAIGQMNRRAIVVELLRKTNEKKLSFKIKEIQQKSKLLLPKQCSAVKLLPERRSGYKTFTGTAYQHLMSMRSVLMMVLIQSQNRPSHSRVQILHCKETHTLCALFCPWQAYAHIGRIILCALYDAFRMTRTPVHRMQPSSHVTAK